ncbi:MAG: hypothetical protein AAF718_03435 [Pseudomonadota bacterium]
MSPTGTKFSTRVLRKQDDLPRYIVVPPEHVTGRSSSFLAAVTLNGHGPFERNIRPWGKGSEVFFFNLTAVQCTKAQLETNSPCEVIITPKDAGPGKLAKEPTI